MGPSRGRFGSTLGAERSGRVDKAHAVRTPAPPMGPPWARFGSTLGAERSGRVDKRTPYERRHRPWDTLGQGLVRHSARSEAGESTSARRTNTGTAHGTPLGKVWFDTRRGAKQASRQAHAVRTPAPPMGPP